MASIRHLGDCALVIEFGQSIDPATQRHVQAFAGLLDRQTFSWLLESVPAFATITLYYDPFQAPYAQVRQEVEALLQTMADTMPVVSRTVEIPVCYEGGYAPDLEFVATHNGLTPQAVIDIHTRETYLVYMIGFAPGFPYLGGLSEEIATPRRAAPRLTIPAGSVGIAGGQTGVYPIETPGGWQLIGRTPLKLFRPSDESPSLLQAGDLVRFYPISSQEYQSLEEERR